MSKMTFSLEENSPATVFQKALKSPVEEMTLPELVIVSLNCRRSHLEETYYRP